MNVVHVIPSLDPSQGGPVIALLGLVKAQAKLGQTVQVVVGSHSTSATIAREMEEFGVRVTLTPPQSGRVFESLHVTVAVRRRLPGADVVHIHGLWQFAQTAGAFEARRLGIPYIIRPCGMLDSWSLSQNRILKQLHLAVVTRQLLNGATMLHVTTEREMSEIAGLELRPPMIVVPNGVDDKAFDDAEYEASPELAALKKSHRILLFLGRVHSKKGLDVLVPA